MTQRRERNWAACVRLPEEPGAFFSFPAICYQKQHEGLEELNEELRRLILKEEGEQPSVRQGVSIRGGYHSDTTFLDRDSDAVRRLKDVLVQDIGSYTRVYWQYESTVPMEHVSRAEDFQARLWGWSVVLREGDYSELHMHPQANLSGVYYVCTNSPVPQDFEHAGNLVLCDPRASAVAAPILGQASTLKIPASPGGTIMFPSYMQHYVLPFRGPGERISVAFNVKFLGAAADPAFHMGPGE